MMKHIAPVGLIHETLRYSGKLSVCRAAPMTLPDTIEMTVITLHIDDEPALVAMLTDTEGVVIMCGRTPFPTADIAGPVRVVL